MRPKAAANPATAVAIEAAMKANTYLSQKASQPDADHPKPRATTTETGESRATATKVRITMSLAVLARASAKCADDPLSRCQD